MGIPITKIWNDTTSRTLNLAVIVYDQRTVDMPNVLECWSCEIKTSTYMPSDVGMLRVELATYWVTINAGYNINEARVARSIKNDCFNLVRTRFIPAWEQTHKRQVENGNNNRAGEFIAPSANPALRLELNNVTEDTSIYSMVSVMPEFPGGDEGLREYILKV